MSNPQSSPSKSRLKARAAKRRYAMILLLLSSSADAADFATEAMDYLVQNVCAAANGKALQALRFEEMGVQLTALRRAGVRETKLQPDMRLQSGDVLVLAGTPEALARAEMRLLQG